MNSKFYEPVAAERKRTMAPKGKVRICDLPQWQREMMRETSHLEPLREGFTILRDFYLKKADFIANRQPLAETHLEWVRTEIAVYSNMLAMVDDAYRLFTQNDDLTVGEHMVVAFRICRCEILELRRLMSVKESILTVAQAIARSSERDPAVDLHRLESEVFIHTEDVAMAEQGYARIRDSHLENRDRFLSYPIPAPTAVGIAQKHADAYENLIFQLNQCRKPLKEKNLPVFDRLTLACNLIERETQALRQLMEVKESVYKLTFSINSAYSQDVTIV